MSKHPLVTAIDRAVELDPNRENPFRRHLGGSMIGKPCERELWYSFRWALEPSHKGRLLRLFARGQREEEQFVNYLRRIGIEVWEADENGNQFRILDVDGHFGGSLDGVGQVIEPIPFDHQELEEIPGGEPFLLEFKTHNTKSFCDLVANGVEKSKPVHFAQMQIYMYKMALNYAVYFAVNKNDDDLHAEVVRADPAIGASLIEKARRVIHSKKAPDRISNNPAFHVCKWCDYAKQCHYNEPLRRSCRTCQFAVPVADGQWHCSKWAANIPVDVVSKGCDEYKVVTD